PGIYSTITVSGNAWLTMSPGIYEIAGGGFNVSGKAQGTGSGVLIYNDGSHYPTGTGGTYGAINIGGQAVVPPYGPATAPYAGRVICQPRDNTQPLSFSGLAAADLNGLVYAPSAVASVSSTLPLEQTTLVVDELQVSGNGSAIPYPASGGSSGGSPMV